ncbi:MAG: esterase-like activity of phytase family protein [Hyphomicrobiales bacterium]
MIELFGTIHRCLIRFSLVILIGVMTTVGLAQQTATADDIKKIDVTVDSFSDFQPQFPKKREFGSLLFKGGGVFAAQPRSFGGFSGMQILDQGRSLLAVSDTGLWFVADIKRNKQGEILSLENARMAPLYSGKGPRKNTLKYFVDAEALLTDGNDVYVAFEAINVISKYKLDTLTLKMEPTILPLPKSIDLASINKGMEALARVPGNGQLAGHLVAITERGKSRLGPTFGWILNPEGSLEKTGMFTVKRDNLFDVTEAGFLKNGDLIILERRFTIADGVAMRLRRIQGDQLKAGAVLTGEVILEAGLSHRIDNMEAMSIYENSKGETVLAFMSDDNHSLLQRTIFLEFVLSQS